METIELEVLEACQEAVLRQREMLPLLADALNIPDHQVFYSWVLHKSPQRGLLEGNEWSYFFHGLECDLKNHSDGRFVRLDFGPHGRADTFTAWGVLQFIMTSTPPWLEFANLRAQFANCPPPFDQFSGSMDKLTPVWDRLKEQGLFKTADENLADLQIQHSIIGPDGLVHVRFPPDISMETRLDCSVANREVLSARATQLLEADLATRSR